MPRFGRLVRRKVNALGWDEGDHDMDVTKPGRVKITTKHLRLGAGSPPEASTSIPALVERTDVTCQPAAPAHLLATTPTGTSLPNSQPIATTKAAPATTRAER
jgi:hypothetical protein